jgi:hypothetical protein
VEKFDFAVEKQCVWWKKQLAACSGKLCIIHAVKRRDLQLVVEKLDFAVENSACSGKNG